MARILIAFVSVILTLSIATALLFFGFEWYEENLIHAVWWVGISSIVIGIICLVLWAFRDKIFGFLNLSTKIGLQNLIDPAACIVEHGLGGRVKEAASETKVLLHRLLSRYAAVKTMNWIIGTTFGFLAIFATMAATAVLVKQNTLIDKQNTYFQKQNEKFDTQNSLVESQNEYFQEQNKKIQEQLDDQRLERQRANRNRLLDILYQEKVIESMDEGTVLDFESKDKKRKIPKANSRLRQEAILEFIKLERDACRHGDKLDLRGAILSGLDLSHDRLMEVGLDTALQGADLRDAHLEDTRLIQTKLFGANLEGVHMNGAHLDGANLNNANLERANLEEANLIGAEMNGAKLLRANLKKAKLSEARLEKTLLKYANLEEANLISANLSYANLSFAEMEKADFKHAIMKEVSLEQARSAFADFSFADLGKAKMFGADLEGAYMIGTYLEKADLRNANLIRADLDRANLIEAQLERSKLGMINLMETKLFGAQLEGAEVDSLDWIKKFYHLDPPVTNYEYWSVEEKTIKDRGTIYLLIGPLEAQKPIP